MKLFIKNLLFTILIPGTVAVYVPLMLVRGRSISTNLLFAVLGIMLVVIGLIVYGWTVWDFASYGRGTPLPVDAPKKLVMRGLYRYVRNPMYVGVILIILGWVGVFTDGWLLVYGLGVGCVVHLFVVGYEEPRLKKLFGEEYASYQEAVGRWLPHLQRKTG